MRIAYLILAHDDPVHLSRLVRRLAYREDRCFIHVDAKAPVDRFGASKIESSELIAPRIPVYWGDFSQIEAEHALLAAGVAAQPEFDYFVLLSGADYPVQPAWYIHDHVRRHEGVEFLSAVKMPCERAGKPLSRIERYRCRPPASLLHKAMFTLQVGLKLRSQTRAYRHVFGDLEPFGGSAWWALSRAAAQYVLQFFADRPEVIAFYQNVRCPDESLFHTILMNSPFAARVSHNVTYVDWSQGGRRPAQLTDRHVDLFESQPRVILKGVYGIGEALFARKLSDADAALVDRLDRMIERRGGTPGLRDGNGERQAAVSRPSRSPAAARFV